MPNILAGKSIVLGVTGSIACYKAVDLASKLTQSGCLVDIILSRGATEFVTPLTFRSITHRPVVTDTFDTSSELAIEHVALASRAELLVIAPTTANFIAKLAHGLADDALTTTALATEAPLLIAPAMDGNMYRHPAVQENLERLRARGVHIVGPEQGRLASGLMGKGRLVPTEELLGHIRLLLARSGDLAGRTVVVSAGGTQESIDPVRVITNRSSGKMGHAIAEAARDRGAQCILITAADLPEPVGVATHYVKTVAQMREAVLTACQDADSLIMAAAVSDYRPAKVSKHKVKKDKDGEAPVLQLVKNADFTMEVPGNVLQVGFAAETENLLANAKGKLFSKGLDLICMNDVTALDSGFGTDNNRVTILDQQGSAEELPLLPKYEVGHRILDRVEQLLKQKD